VTHICRRTELQTTFSELFLPLPTRTPSARLVIRRAASSFGRLSPIRMAWTLSPMGPAKMKHLVFASFAFLTLIAVAAVITAAD
jgi:hypothetical protein